MQYRRICWIVLEGIMLLFSYKSYSQLTGTDYLSKPARVISWQVNVEGLTTVSAVNSSSDNVVKTYRYMDGHLNIRV